MEQEWDLILDHNQARHLDRILELEELRLDEPLVWMVLIGTSHSRDIAAKLGWPHDFVMVELRRLKKDGLLFDEVGTSRMLWRIHPEAGGLIDLDNWRRRESKRGGLFNPTENGEE